jgi:hypothetical protein
VQGYLARISKDIDRFFSDHRCEKADLKLIENPEEKQLHMLNFCSLHNPGGDMLSAL